MPMLIHGLLQIDSLVQSTNAWDWVTARLVSEEGGQMKVSISPIPNSACDQLLGHTREPHPLYMSSALL